MNEVTRILGAIEGGDPHAAPLLPLVYDELRMLAAGHMASEAAGHTLGATALVHEAYLRLVGPLGQRTFANRGHFSRPLEQLDASADELRTAEVKRACGPQRRPIDRDGVGPKVPLDASVDVTEARCGCSNELGRQDPGRPLAASED